MLFQIAKGVTIQLPRYPAGYIISIKNVYPEVTTILEPLTKDDDEFDPVAWWIDDVELPVYPIKLEQWQSVVLVARSKSI